MGEGKPLSTRSPDEILMPGGSPIGARGRKFEIRELSGGADDADQLFGELTEGGTNVTPPGYPGKLYELPGGGRVGLRAHSKSGQPTIDVNIPGVPIKKLKFK